MDEIKHRGDRQGDGRKARRRRDFADHHIVPAKVQGRHDDPIGDRLGQGLFDREAERRGRRGFDGGRGAALGGLEQRREVSAQPGQASWREHRGGANRDAGNQRGLQQSGAGHDRADGRGPGDEVPRWPRKAGGRRFGLPRDDGFCSGHGSILFLWRFWRKLVYTQ